eukprot:350044-Chlamydomonas_euryale.AAC.8
MRNVPVVAPLFGTSSSDLATLNRSLGQRSQQRRRNVPWIGKAGGTLLKALLRCNLRSLNRLDVWHGHAAHRLAGVANVVQPFLVCDLAAGECC